MTFLYPQYLWWLLGLPLIGAVLLFSALRAHAGVRALVGSYIRRDVTNLLTIKSFVVSVLFTVAASSLVVAIADPQWGEVSVEDERRGLEVVFLVDVSNSMLVDDVPPSRLLRSREVIRSVVSRIPEIHHAVVVFRGGSSVVVPMTDDPAAFELAVGSLSPSLVTSPGTELSGAVVQALDVFPGGTPRHRVVVLFSDGGHDSGLDGAVLERVRDEGIPIHAVVAGTPAGGTIPTTQGGVLRDASGEPVFVGIEEERMRRLADLSGGELYYLIEPNSVARLGNNLKEVGGFEASVLFRQVSVKRYHLFALLSLMLITLIVLISSIRWRGLV